MILLLYLLLKTLWMKDENEASLACIVGLFSGPLIPL